MKQYLIVVLLCAIITVSCDNKKESPLPIERTALINLLADVHIAEQMANFYRIDDRDSMQLIFMDSVYMIHKVDSTQFAGIKEYLFDHIETYHKIEKEVHKKLKNMAE